MPAPEEVPPMVIYKHAEELVKEASSWALSAAIPLGLYWLANYRAARYLTGKSDKPPTKAEQKMLEHSVPFLVGGTFVTHGLLSSLGKAIKMFKKGDLGPDCIEEAREQILDPVLFAELYGEDSMHLAHMALIGKWAEVKQTFDNQDAKISIL